MTRRLSKNPSVTVIPRTGKSVSDVLPSNWGGGAMGGDSAGDRDTVRYTSLSMVITVVSWSNRVRRHFPIADASPSDAKRRAAGGSDDLAILGESIGNDDSGKSMHFVIHFTLATFSCQWLRPYWHVRTESTAVLQHKWQQRCFAT